MLGLKYESFVRQHAWLVERTLEVHASRMQRLGCKDVAICGIVFHEEGATVCYEATDSAGKDLRDELEVESYEWFLVNESANAASPIQEADLYEFNAFQMFIRLTAQGILAQRLAAVSNDGTKWGTYGFQFDQSGCKVSYYTLCADQCGWHTHEFDIPLADLFAAWAD